MSQGVASVPGPRFSGPEGGAGTTQRRGGPRDIYGALDLGTNNCRLLIARPTDGGFTVLDAFSLLASGLAAADRLYAEIDAVARAYHWSEAEILALPIARRRRYLGLIGAMAAP